MLRQSSSSSLGGRSVFSSSLLSFWTISNTFDGFETPCLFSQVVDTFTAPRYSILPVHRGHGRFHFEQITPLLISELPRSLFETFADPVRNFRRTHSELPRNLIGTFVGSPEVGPKIAPRKFQNLSGWGF
ncbi:hypothetical protein Y032_0063g3414 [Ancylostoma ceylanicum]|uniref:Uncharacterized protein n=1 Tax=Ancylostoma ceylanicum TaxID=53326 RepID=A0A016U2Q1_9BILA|nr:hypothetical protein Y032_0063g3414 [Ancylostoma ceylanicum]